MFEKIKRWFRPKLPEGEQYVDETDEGKLYEHISIKGCVDCGNKKFMEGPSGGVCTNIFCSRCGAGYNVTPIVGIAERIHRDERYIEKRADAKS